MPQGASYSPCAPGVQPTVATPCEPGAQAMDPDGSQQGSMADLTSKVLACPPAECLLPAGCSPALLHAHRFAVHGLRGCSIDTLAQEGTQFNITFWVFDSGSPPLNASVVRTLTLASPCPGSEAPHLCEDARGQRYCSGGQGRARAGTCRQAQPAAGCMQLVQPARQRCSQAAGRALSSHTPTTEQGRRAAGRHATYRWPGRGRSCSCCRWVPSAALCTSPTALRRLFRSTPALAASATPAAPLWPMIWMQRARRWRI